MRVEVILSLRAQRCNSVGVRLNGKRPELPGEDGLVHIEIVSSRLGGVTPTARRCANTVFAVLRCDNAALELVPFISACEVQPILVVGTNLDIDHNAAENILCVQTRGVVERCPVGRRLFRLYFRLPVILPYGEAAGVRGGG